MSSQSVNNIANAIINKINSLISSHNSNENAHQDIRETIPSATSELNNNSGFITSSSVPSASNTTPSADTTNGSVGTGTTWARSNHTHPKSSLYAEASHTHPQYLTSHQDISGKEDTSNKLTSLQSLDDYSTDTQYASAKLIHEYLETKEDTSNKVTSMTDISTDDEYPSAKCVYDRIEERIDDVFGYIPQDLGGMAYEDNVDGYVGAVALSNDYDDLDNKPTIPTATSDLTNDGDGYNPFLTEHQSLANYVRKSQTSGLLKNDGTVDTTAYSTFDGNYNNLTNKPSIPSASSATPSADTTNGSVGTGMAWARSDHTHPKSSLYEDNANKVTSLSSSSTDTQYPSAKAVYDEIWTDLYGTIQSDYVSISSLGTVAFSNNYDDLDNLPQLGELAYENDVDLSGHDLDELSDNTNLLFSGSYNDLNDKPSIPSNTSDLNNNSGFITDSQAMNDNICNYKTLIPLIDENEQIYDFSFEDYDFDIMFIINPKENDCQGSVGIGDPAFGGVYIQYSNQEIHIRTESGDEFNIALNMSSENIIKIKQDESTNDLTITVNDYEVVSTGNSEILKNILYITSTVGTISNFGVKICTQIITKENFKQELYTDLYDVMDCINVNFDNLDNIYLLDTVFNISNYNGLPSKNSSVVNDILRNNAVSGISLNKEFTPSTKYTLEFDYYTSVSNRNGFYFGADPLLEDGVSINNSNDGLHIVVDIGNTYVETFNGTSSPTKVYTHTSNLFTSGTHHIRIVRDEANVTFYIDDVELYTYANVQYNTIGLDKWGGGYNTISNIEIKIGG